VTKSLTLSDWAIAALAAHKKTHIRSVFVMTTLKTLSWPPVDQQRVLHGIVKVTALEAHV
jgi:hypothetical protein